MTIQIQTTKFLYLFIIVASMMTVSCGDDDDDDDNSDPTPQETTDPNSALQFNESDGFCAAVISSTSYTDPISGFTFDIDFGIAAAGFADGDWTSLVPAGGVTCEDVGLNQQTNNSYVYTYEYDPLNPSDLGISFDGNPSWNVTGGSGIPSFDYTTSIDFPTLSSIAGEAIVDRSMDYTISFTGVSGADSLIVQVGNALETITGTASSYTFSADQLANIATGPSIAQVAAYKIEETNQSGKTIHFVNERVKSYSVNIE